jgi:hypothetical protein
MLKKVSNKRVESASGFAVEVRDIHHVVYQRGKETVTVEIEGGLREGVVHWLVYSQTLQGQGPLPIQEKSEVLRHIGEGLEALGMKHSIV